jgi:tRNA(Ile2) C34 agmatinyltransferase TiaS
MNWKNLESNLCPKCRSSLKKSKDKSFRTCANKLCDFSIRQEKLDEIKKNIKDKFTNVHLKEVD